MSKPDLLERALEEHGLPSISAAVFEDGEVTWAQTAGDARPDTQYAIASVTKTFVAAALLELRVDLDEPTRFGTPRQLLSHTSGLQRELPGEEWGTLEFPAHEEVVARFDQAERVLPPGRFHYSNLGYLVLGELVAERDGQAARGRDPGRCCSSRMACAGRRGGHEEPHARGFLRERPERKLVKGGTSASGGLWSTAGDVARWGTHLLGLEELHRPYAHAGWDEAFGLGVECVRVDGRELWGHEGATVGFRSILLYDRDANAGAAVLTNATQFGGVRALAASLVPQSGSRRADEPAPPEIEGILGSWWSEGIEHRFRWTGRLETDDAVFVQEAPDRFRSAQGHEEGELLRVVRGEDGEPIELWWAGYPFRRTVGYSY